MSLEITEEKVSRYFGAMRIEMAEVAGWKKLSTGFLASYPQGLWTPGEAFSESRENF
jgi:hypothetical protein